MKEAIDIVKELRAKIVGSDNISDCLGWLVLYNVGLYLTNRTDSKDQNWTGIAQHIMGHYDYGENK